MECESSCVIRVSPSPYKHLGNTCAKCQSQRFFVQATTSIQSISLEIRHSSEIKTVLAEKVVSKTRL